MFYSQEEITAIRRVRLLGRSQTVWGKRGVDGERLGSASTLGWSSTLRLQLSAPEALRTRALGMREVRARALEAFAGFPDTSSARLGSWAPTSVSGGAAVSRDACVVCR